MSVMPRMRTVQQCAKYLKEHDPESCIGEWCIRKMIARGEIPVLRSGNRFLINLDALLGHLAGEAPENAENEKAPV